MRLLFVLLFLLLAGCSPFRQSVADPAAAGFRIVPGVPFRPQMQGGDCGPAALASLLAHRGVEVPVADLRRGLYSPALEGTLLADLENFAAGRGFTTRSGRGEPELLRRAIDAGRPVLIPIQTGFWAISRPHYLVVYGYGRDRFLVHAGIREAVVMPSTELLPRWEKMGRLYLWLE